MPKNEKVGSQSHCVTSTVSGERVRAFVPPPLPPGPGALDLTSLQAILAEANQSVGRLDGIFFRSPSTTPMTVRIDFES